MSATKNGDATEAQRHRDRNRLAARVARANGIAHREFFSSVTFFSAAARTSSVTQMFLCEVVFDVANESPRFVSSLCLWVSVAAFSR